MHEFTSTLLSALLLAILLVLAILSALRLHRPPLVPRRLGLPRGPTWFSGKRDLQAPAARGMASAWRWGRSEPAKDETTRQVEKLRGYHDLVKDILDRAAVKHREGASGEAMRIYKMGLSACDDALAIPVANPGIGNSNIGTWRRHLSDWRQAIATYIRQYESGLPISSISPPQAQAPSARTRPEPTERSVANRQPSSYKRNMPALTPRQQPARAMQNNNAPPKQAQPGKSESKGDERLREMILSDVLDDRPTVSWDSIAGLNKAKQALQVSKPTLPFLSWTICHAQARIRS